MDTPELLSRLYDREDGFTERKPESVNAGDLRRTLTAFANSASPDRAGVLFIGVADEKMVSGPRVIGVKQTDAVQKSVRTAAQDCYPTISFQSHVLEIDGLCVVAVVVPASRSRPHFSGAAFVRIGSESCKASTQLYEELIASRNDKAGYLLMHKGEAVSVVSHRRLESVRQEPRGAWTERCECVIESVDAHILKLKNREHGANYTVPLSAVEISEDTQRGQLQIRVAPSHH